MSPGRDAVISGRPLVALVSAVVVVGVGLVAALTEATSRNEEPVIAEPRNSTSETVPASSSTKSTENGSAPTQSADTSINQGTAGGFVELFDRGTGLDRFDFGVFHRDTAAEWPGATSWSADHDMNCGSPDTQRTVRRDTNEWIFLCRDHIMTSIGDTSGYSTGWFTPKQTFSNATQVSWDVGVTDLMGRQWWEVLIVPLSFNSGIATCPYCATLDWMAATAHLPGYPVGSVAVGNGPGGGDIRVSTDGIDRNVAYGYRTCNFDPEGCASKAIRRPFSMTDNRNGTITVNYGGVRTFTVPGSFPAGGFRVVFKDHNYTPDKDGIPVGHTWHWDNIAVQ